MRIRVSDAVTQPARVVNEDGWVDSGGQLWVLDGASGLTSVPVTDGPTDAAWLVDRARIIIEQRAARPSADGLVGTLAAIVGDVESFLPSATSAPAHELPSASLVAIAIESNELHVLTLGDCRLILRTPGDTARVIDDASVLDRLDGGAIELLAAEQRRTGTPIDIARASIADLLRRNRDRLNGPDGYHALAPGLDVADIARHRIPVCAGTTGLLVSDGFYRLIDTFNVHDADGLLDAVAKEGAATVLDQLRVMEADDPEGHRFPRLKRSDDATAVAFEIIADAEA